MRSGNLCGSYLIKTRSEAVSSILMTSESSKYPNRGHSAYSCPLWRFFRKIGYPFSALLVGRDKSWVCRGGLVGIWGSNGAKQRARQCSSGGLVLDGLVICRFYGIDTSTGLVVPPLPLAFNACIR